MASTIFSPPEILAFNVGTTTESSAVLAAKLVKKVKKHRLPIKSSFWQSSGQAAKAASRRLMLTRSSALRQWKFAEARSRTNSTGQAVTLPSEAEKF